MQKKVTERFKIEKLEERIAPSIITTSTTTSSTKATKHPGPTDTLTTTTTTTVSSTNPAGHNPPGQPNYTDTSVVSTEVPNRFAR